MKSLARCMLTGLVLALGGAAVQAAPAAVNVEVRFVAPEQFRDANESVHERERTLDQLAQYLRASAQPRLAPGQRLVLEVLDLNLAGEIEPVGSRMDRLRVMRDIAWPTMELRYVLSEGDKTVREATVRLSDMRYLDGIHRLDNGEPLHYEKRMLERWLSAEFAAP